LLPLTRHIGMSKLQGTDAHVLFVLVTNVKNY